MDERWRHARVHRLRVNCVKAQIMALISERFRQNYVTVLPAHVLLE